MAGHRHPRSGNPSAVGEVPTPEAWHGWLSHPGSGDLGAGEVPTPERAWLVSAVPRPGDPHGGRSADARAGMVGQFHPQAR